MTDIDVEPNSLVVKEDFDITKPPEPNDPYFREYAEKMAPKKLSPRHRMVCLYAAMGWNQKKIALEFEYTQSRICILMSSQIFREEITRLREEQFGSKSTRERIGMISNEAMDVVETIMRDEAVKASTRADIAFKLIEQNVGKAKIAVEVHNSTFKDMLELLKEARRTHNPVVEPKFVESEQIQKTGIDSWLDSRKGVVNGK